MSHADWKQIKLRDICDEITVGHVGPMASEYVDSGIPFFRSQNIKPFWLDFSDIKFVTPEFHKKLKKSALHPGDVVVVRTGYPGVATVIPKTLEKSNCSDLVIIRKSPNIDSIFLVCIFNSQWGQSTVSGNLVGAAQQHFNIGAAKEVKINIPPLPTQQKIASILSAYTSLIQNNTRRIKILEEMAQIIYREWFVNFRFPGHEAVRMVESELGPVPEGWEKKKISDISILFRGRSYGSDNLVEEGGHPFLNLKCLDRDGGFRSSGIKRYQGPYKETQTATEGDIVIAVTDMTQERRIVAHAARIPRMEEPLSVISMDLVKIVPKEGIYSEYLYGILRHSSFADEIKQHANGVNVLHLTPNRIGEYEFYIAPKELRQSYMEIIGPCQEMCDILQLKNANLRRTRDLLLPKLISGELDVSELDIRIPEAEA